MKIVSLLPSATEIVYALGLGDQLAAVTHECDYPPEVKAKPVITRSILPSGLDSAAIDAAVRGQLDQSHSLYTIDREMLAEIGPDLILTQQLCDVCAVAYSDVVAAVRSLPHPGPRVVNLEPNTLDDVLQTITLVGVMAGREEKAAQVTARLRERIEYVRQTAANAAARPRTVLLEWIDPLFGGGHWDPELVEIAGGVDSIGSLHQPSTQVSWEAVQNFAPEILVIAQCGFSVERSAQDMPRLEALLGYRDLPAVQNGRVYLVNGSDYFSRPGPRLVDSLEMLACLLHPELFGPVQESPT
ncbi:MAG: cobalamin-binding protein [Armatimonadota bacterium]|nr:cobalamin-binding protein [Armatimonadota bacterium]